MVVIVAAAAAVVITVGIVINSFMQGTVKWYDAVKGFGFIQTSEDQDVFVHRSGIKDAHLGLETGQKVEFETKDSDRGSVAFNVESI